MLVADPLRGDEALVGVRRRHPDVDDGGVGRGAPHLSQQLVGVAGLAGDVDPGVLEQADDALAGEHRVVGDDYAHGITARSRRLALTRPPSAPTRSASRAAVPAVGDPDVGARRQSRSPSTATSTRRPARAGILDAPRRPAGRPRSRPPRAGAPAAVAELDRDRGGRRRARQRRAEPGLGEDRRVDAVREVAQLVERRLGLGAGLGERVRAASPSRRPGASRSSSDSASSRCWAPSWRSRSSRRRAASPVSTIAGQRGAEVLELREHDRPAGARCRPRAARRRRSRASAPARRGRCRARRSPTGSPWRTIGVSARPEGGVERRTAGVDEASRSRAADRRPAGRDRRAPAPARRAVEPEPGRHEVRDGGACPALAGRDPGEPRARARRRSARGRRTAREPGPLGSSSGTSGARSRTPRSPRPRPRRGRARATAGAAPRRRPRPRARPSVTRQRTATTAGVPSDLREPLVGGTRNTLSVQLLQQCSSANGSRTSARPMLSAPTTAYAGATARARPPVTTSTRCRRSTPNSGASTSPRLRTSGGPPSQPIHSGATQTTPAAIATGPARRRSQTATTPAANSEIPATRLSAASSSDARRVAGGERPERGSRKPIASRVGDRRCDERDRGPRPISHPARHGTVASHSVARENGRGRRDVAADRAAIRSVPCSTEGDR